MARCTAGFRRNRPGANVLRDTCVPCVGVYSPNYLISLFDWYGLRRAAMHMLALNLRMVRRFAGKSVGNVWKAMAVS